MRFVVTTEVENPFSRVSETVRKYTAVSKLKHCDVEDKTRETNSAA